MHTVATELNHNLKLHRRLHVHCTSRSLILLFTLGRTVLASLTPRTNGTCPQGIIVVVDVCRCVLVESAQFLP
ncbi:hypothetical protein EDB19DRAFT_1726781, partial [Suillus lakei]